MFECRHAKYVPCIDEKFFQLSIIILSMLSIIKENNQYIYFNIIIQYNIAQLYFLKDIRLT